MTNPIRPAFIDEAMYCSDTDLAVEDLVDAANDFVRASRPRRPQALMLALLECVVACAKSTDLSDHAYEDIEAYLAKWLKQ